MEFPYRYSQRFLWSVWVLLTFASALGLWRYTNRAELPLEIDASGRGLHVTGVTDIAAVSPDWPPTGTFLLREVEGITVNNQWNIRLALAGRRYGEPVQLLLDPVRGEIPDEARRQSVVLVKGFTLSAFLLLVFIGVCMLGLSALLIYERRRHPATIPLAAALAMLGTALVQGEWGAPLGTGMGSWFPGLAWTFTYAILPHTILMFSSTFPKRSEFWRGRVWIRKLVGFLAVAVGSGTAIGMFIYTSRGSDRVFGYNLCLVCQYVLWALLVGSAVLMGTILITSYRASDSWAARNRVRWVLFGVILGGLPPLLLTYIPRLTHWYPPVEGPLVQSFLLLLPICVAIAVVRHQLLDISVVVRQGLMYGPATLGVYAVFGSAFVVVVFFLLRTIVRDIQLNLPVIVILAIPAILFQVFYEPLRRRVQRLVDKRFFRTKYSYGPTVRSFAVELETRFAGNDILEFLCDTVDGTINPTWVQVLDREGRWKVSRDDEAQVTSTKVPHVRLPFHELGDLELLLGPKRSGMAYHNYDRALLETLVGLSSAALSRELLQRSLMEQAAEKERLEALNRLKDDFLSLVSHDLRSPLTAITMSADLMMRRAPEGEDEDSRADALRIKRNALRLGHMVERLLHAARVEAGRVEPDLGSCSLHEITELVFDRHGLLAENAGVALDNSVPDTAYVRADPVLLQEAISNLVDNALKVSERGMSIRIAAERVNGEWELTVSDYGPGIPEEILSNLFKRRTATAEGERKTSGFGMGLYLVNELIRLQGGGLELRSSSSHGTTFAILLPEMKDEKKNPDS